MYRTRPLIRSERGFTLAELLVVILILGGLTSIVVLAITRFAGKGTAEAANAEVHQARAAIESCFSEAGVTTTDNAITMNWNGAEDVLTVTGSDGTAYDAADYLRSDRFKATYVVSGNGDITGIASCDWAGITWVDDHWE